MTALTRQQTPNRFGYLAGLLLLMTAAVALLVGEGIRDVRYVGIDPQNVDLHTYLEIPKSSK